MYMYRIQIEKINYYQVDVTVDGPNPIALREAAIKQGNREFGQSDDTELDEIELISTKEKTPKELLEQPPIGNALQVGDIISCECCEEDFEITDTESWLYCDGCIDGAILEYS